jgi:glycosyltransferase involved in cell wall biosynthesis
MTVIHTTLGNPPLHGEKEPAKRASSVAVVIPALNEAESIAVVITMLPRDVIERVIVVDGGSSDGTREVACRAGAEIINVGNGYGRACLAGAQAADKSGIIVFMDGDGADDPAAISDIVSAIDVGGYDFVIGSRVRGKRERASMANHQILAGWAAGFLINLFYGVRYTDMAALRAIRREALLKLGMRELTYGWNLEMQMRAARSGLRILELPVGYRRRSGGQSKIAGNLSNSIKAAACIIATFARVALE